MQSFLREIDGQKTMKIIQQMDAGFIKTRWRFLYGDI